MAHDEDDAEQRRREHRRERQRRYREKNREKIAVSEAAWRARNPDYHREWREKNRERVNALQREWRARRDPELRRADKKRHWDAERGPELQRKYGLSLQQYEAMVNAQDGACAICGRQGNVGGMRLAVDHCHETGVVRGLLCNPCNTLLGNAGDNISLLTDAIAYLLAHRDVLKGGLP